MITLKELRTAPIAGNAYHDMPLLTGAWDLALSYASHNRPQQSFEVLDILGVRVMGADPLTWAEFEECLRFAIEVGP